MKVLAAICVVVLLLQLGTVGLGVVTGGGEEPTDEEIENGDWDPQSEVPIAAGFERLLEPFRPRLDLPWRQHTFASGPPQSVEFRNGDEDRRVAKFELTRGTGVRIGYQCNIQRRGYECPQIACLCRPAGATVDPADFSDCPASWLEGGRCPADGDKAEIVVYSEEGQLQFLGLGDDGGTVRQR